MEFDLFVCEDRRGLNISSECVKLQKDTNNLIGISIGGGAPFCPCLYIVQLFDNSNAAACGTLMSGDEIIAVNKQCVKGMSKVEVAKLIQSLSGEVILNFNKLHADPKQGKSLDIIMKKLKHNIVEKMSSSTADALGISRAILCNDILIAKMEQLHLCELIYKNIIEYFIKIYKSLFCWSQSFKELSDIFYRIAQKESQFSAAQAFNDMAKVHRNMYNYGIDVLKKGKILVGDLRTFSKKVIPDTKLTVKKYADAKFEYLSYCLKIKEMDDEEYTFAALNEPLYRVETGNYEYRLILRCRQESRLRFSKIRGDVMEKIELLEQKYLQDVVKHLRTYFKELQNYHEKCFYEMKNLSIFPIEVDISTSIDETVVSNNTFPTEENLPNDNIINLN